MIALMMIGTKTISTTTISSSKTGTRAFNNTRFGRASNDTFSRGSLKKKGEQRTILLRPKAASVAPMEDAAPPPPPGNKPPTDDNWGNGGGGGGDDGFAVPKQASVMARLMMKQENSSSCCHDDHHHDEDHEVDEAAQQTTGFADYVERFIALKATAPQCHHLSNDDRVHLNNFFDSVFENDIAPAVAMKCIVDSVSGVVEYLLFLDRVAMTMEHAHKFDSIVAGAMFSAATTPRRLAIFGVKKKPQSLLS